MGLGVAKKMPTRSEVFPAAVPLAMCPTHWILLASVVAELLLQCEPSFGRWTLQGFSMT